LQVIYPDIPDNYRTRLDLQWPIYTGGRTDALLRAARAEASASGDELTVARADLRLEITRAFWALVTANESVTVLQESLLR
jgi:outer membrane protein TolC